MSNQNNNHQKTKKTLKIVGICLIAVGAILTIVSLINFFTNIGTGSIPKLFFLSMIGLPMLAVGCALTIFGFKKEITNYAKNETYPIINQMAQDISPAFSTMSQSIKQDKIICQCGAENDANSKFCKNCGKPLVVTCPHCGKEVAQGSKFCNHCGKNLDD